MLALKYNQWKSCQLFTEGFNTRPKKLTLLSFNKNGLNLKIE